MKRRRSDDLGSYSLSDEKLCVTVRYAEVLTAADDRKACQDVRASHQKTLQELEVALQRAEQALKKITGAYAVIVPLAFIFIAIYHFINH